MPIGTEEREMQRPDQESEAQPDVEDTGRKRTLA